MSQHIKQVTLTTLISVEAVTEGGSLKMSYFQYMEEHNKLGQRGQKSWQKLPEMHTRRPLNR